MTDDLNCVSYNFVDHSFQSTDCGKQLYFACAFNADDIEQQKKLKQWSRITLDDISTSLVQLKNRFHGSFTRLSEIKGSVEQVECELEEAEALYVPKVLIIGGFFWNRAVKARKFLRNAQRVGEIIESIIQPDFDKSWGKVGEDFLCIQRSPPIVYIVNNSVVRYMPEIVDENSTQANNITFVIKRGEESNFYEFTLIDLILSIATLCISMGGIIRLIWTQLQSDSINPTVPSRGIELRKRVSFITKDNVYEEPKPTAPTRPNSDASSSSSSSASPSLLEGIITVKN